MHNYLKNVAVAVLFGSLLLFPILTPGVMARTSDKAIVLITSTPNASIYLDGDYIGRAPLETEIEIGDHTFGFTKENYSSKTVTRTILPDVQNLIHEPLGFIAQLELSASEDYTEVFIDDISKGFAPLTVQTTIGKHHLKFEKPGFQDFEEEIVVNPYGLNSFYAELLPTVNLNLVVYPRSAEVYIDDEKIIGTLEEPIITYNEDGTALLSIKLNQGKHTLRVTHSKEVFEYQEEFTVQSGADDIEKTVTLVMQEYEEDLDTVFLDQYYHDKRVWRTKTIISGVSALIAGVIAVSSFQLAADAEVSYNEQKDNVLAAQSYEEAAEYNEAAEDDRAELVRHSENAAGFGAVFLGLAGLTLYFWSDEPENPGVVTLEPIVTPDGRFGFSHSIYF